jgi:hypothetical protein
MQNLNTAPTIKYMGHCKEDQIYSFRAFFQASVVINLTAEDLIFWAGQAEENMREKASASA